MRLLLIILIALVAAVVAGHFAADDTGFVVIGYGGKVLRTSFTFFALVLLTAAVALYAALRLASRLLSAPRQWRGWSRDRRQRREIDALSGGLLALAAGDAARAERQFLRDLQGARQPAAHYFAAAIAAQAQRSPARRDNYLTLAANIEPRLRDAFIQRRADWLLQRGHADEAAPLVKALSGRSVRSPQLLQLQYELARQQQDHRALFDLLPALKRDRVLAPGDLSALERTTAIAVMEHPGQTEAGLSEHWQSLPRALRAEPRTLAAYARALMGCQAHARAEACLRKHLDRHWDSALVALYGELMGEPRGRQLRKIEAWAHRHGDDPGLRLAWARQAIRNELWGQAQEQLAALLETSPSALVHSLMAKIADGLGDTETAAAHRAAGLALVTESGATRNALLPPGAA